MPQWGVATDAKGFRHVAVPGCRGLGGYLPTKPNALEWLWHWLKSVLNPLYSTGDRACVKKLGKARGNGGVVVLGELGCDVGRQHPELVYATGACAVEQEQPRRLQVLEVWKLL